MVQVLDVNGKPLFSTNKHGKVRRLLRDKKAKLIKNEPFTIQLLCSLEESGEFSYKEKNNMKTTIVSNVLTNELGVKDKIYMSYDEFLLIAKSNQGIDLTDSTLMFDVEGLSEELYNDILPWYNDLDKDTIKFFIYNTKSFIKESIEVINAQIKDNDKPHVLSHEELMKDNYGINRLSSSVNAHTLIYSEDFNDRKELMTNFNIQLSNKGFNCITCSLDNMSIEEIDQTVVKFRNEMMQRFKLMEHEQVNNAYKLSNPPEYMALFVEDFDKISSSDQYKHVESIRSSIGYLLRLSSATCIKVFISTSSLSIGKDFINNSNNRIIIGPYTEKEATILFNTNQVQQLPKGIGLVYSGNDSTMFSINAIKSL